MEVDFPEALLPDLAVVDLEEPALALVPVLPVALPEAEPDLLRPEPEEEPDDILPALPELLPERP